MAGVNDVNAKVVEYSEKYRHPDMPPICISKIYSLEVNDEYCWPDTWPHNSRRGIYAIIGSGNVLYIGKASQQWIGKRLSSYFRYGPNRECITCPGHTWSEKPTHVIAWAVPVDTPFEASGLEEFVIRELAAELPDNALGKRE